ncbi:hypothetical protein [Haloarchaeobius salinus]|uniref:hypothetical protein n=1 Tax=Haloarchaeobius salinus TaxID=1198298 RepID=UPI00210E6FA3|nr:hypothetical protein [Haloarchaeobius salinus]
MNVKRIAVVIVFLVIGSVIAGTLQSTTIAGMSEAQRTALGIAFSTPVGIAVFALVASTFDTDGYLAERSWAGKFGDLVFVELAAVIGALATATALEGVIPSVAGWAGAGLGYFAAFFTFLWRASEYNETPARDGE